MGGQSFVAFGLTNTTIGSATYTSNQFQGFTVSNLGTNGTDGLSIHLGQADSGVFVYPATDRDPATGSFMAGGLYGSVNGETNRLICFMRCHEEMNEYHPVAIDFSSLGPTHLTFQAFRFGALVAQTDPQPGPMVVYGNYFTPYYPRVNPFWRRRDGSVGALIEFTEVAAVWLPGVGDVSADRIFIRADNPTNVVDFASRLDITAQLPYFDIYDARLGVFNRAHRAMGDAHLLARLGTLNVSNLGTNVEDGLAIELSAAVRFDAAFAPIQLGTNGTLSIVALGDTDAGPGVLASAFIVHAQDLLEISGQLDSATNILVAVFNNGVQSGMAAGTNVAVPSTASVTGYEMHTRTAGGPLAVILRLNQTVPITMPNQTSVQGDEIRFTGFGEFGTLKTLTLNSMGMDEFTIVSETEYPLPSPRLEIVRSGSELKLSWIDPYRAFSLEGAGSLGEAFYSLLQFPEYVGDAATVIFQIDLINPVARFLRLSSTPVTPPDS